MRNDARPIGEDAGRQSPVPRVPSAPAARDRSAPSDPRARVTHDRESHIVNRPTEKTVRRKDGLDKP